MSEINTQFEGGYSMEKKEKREQFKDLVIYTTTFYGEDEISKVREKLAEELLKNTEKLNVRCVVVDGGSNNEFLEKVKQLKNVELLVNPALNMGGSRRKALELALEHSDADYFFWIEPEKSGLITEESLNAMVDGLRKGEVDVVVPKRKSKKTLPKFQGWIETRANRRATNIMEEETEMSGIRGEEKLDFWFGPKMFNRRGAEYFLRYKGALDKWDSIIKPVMNAYRDGKKIGSVEVDYEYDVSQTESEEDNKVMKMKRLAQYSQILKELGDKFWNKEK